MNASESSDSTCSDSPCLDVKNETKKVADNPLPSKFSSRYMTCYNDFIDWQKNHEITTLDENTFLIYFEELAKTPQPISLWSQWNMMQTVIYHYHGLNIRTYSNLMAFIKDKTNDHQFHETKAFTEEEILKFINNAPDEIYLAMKVILIFGILGNLTSKNIEEIKINDVQDTRTQLIVTIHENSQSRSFIIKETFYDITRQYMLLRPRDVATDKFFLEYHDSRCFRVPMSRHQIIATPENAARVLNLEEPTKYTKYCFQKTAKSIFVNTDTKSVPLPRGGWRQ